MNDLLEKRLAPGPTDHTIVAIPERRDQLMVQIVLLPSPVPAETGTSGTRHAMATAPSTIADTLQDATWEDAEWR